MPNFFQSLMGQVDSGDIRRNMQIDPTELNRLRQFGIDMTDLSSNYNRTLLGQIMRNTASQTGFQNQLGQRNLAMTGGATSGIVAQQNRAAMQSAADDGYNQWMEMYGRNLGLGANTWQGAQNTLNDNERAWREAESQAKISNARNMSNFTGSVLGMGGSLLSSFLKPASNINFNQQLGDWQPQPQIPFSNPGSFSTRLNQAWSNQFGRPITGTGRPSPFSVAGGFR